VATLRQLRTRVASITNIQRVTNAMYLVATARVRRAQEAILAVRPYAVRLERVLQPLGPSIDPEQHPLLSERPVEGVTMVVVTSDRGLCGGFNVNVCRRALAEMQQYEEQPVALITVGRKGRDFFRNRGYPITQEHTDVFHQLEFSRAATIAQELTTRFLSGSTDRVLLVYSEFRSLAHQAPVVHQLLPIALEKTAEDEYPVDYIFEPDPDRLLRALVPRHVNFQVWRTLLESNAGEQAARMTAMDNAARNAGDLIEELTREMNKERQSAITLELMDIGGGAEAVAQRRRAYLLPKVLETFLELAEERIGTVRAEVRSAVELSEEQAERLRERLTAYTGKNVRLQVRIDESLRGGLVVRIGDTTFDGSLDTHLERLHRQLSGG